MSSKMRKLHYLWVIDQVRVQHGWILAKFILRVSGPRRVRVPYTRKIKRGEYRRNRVVYKGFIVLLRETAEGPRWQDGFILASQAGFDQSCLLTEQAM